MILDILYAVFIQPIEWGMGWIFAKAYGLLGSYGLAIIVLSLVVNLALIPIYYISDRWLEEERSIQDKMKPKLEEIKTVFEGQERFMMTRMLYRIHSYHPLLAVRNSVGLLIQIPFFFAAYQLLSNYEALNGVSFFIFNDLSRPDGLLSIGNWHINIMPFVMTAINLASAYIFAKGLSVKDQAQSYIIAAIFLVLLYTMPVGLVLYWTVNNIFSLIKNLIYKYAVIIRNSFNREVFSKLYIIVFQLSAILTVYSLLTLIISNYLPQGVTKGFFDRSVIYYGFIPVIFIIYLVYKLLATKHISFSKARESVSILDFSGVLVVLIPLSQYIFSNLDVIPFKDAIVSLIYIFTIVSIVLVILPNIFSVLISKRYSQTILLLLLVMIVYMPIVSAYFGFHKYGSSKILLPLFITTLLVSYLLIIKRSYKLLFFLATVFVMNTALTINGSIGSDNQLTSVEARSLDVKPSDKPKFVKFNSVYLLIYDSYVSNEVMQQYGIDNSQQERFLIENGFRLYPSTYSIATQSHSTMGRLLDIKSSESDLWKNVAGDAFVFEQFKLNGYQTSGYFPNTYFFQGSEITYDTFYPSIDRSGSNPLITVYKSVLSGYFGFDIGFDEFSHNSYLDVKSQYFNEKGSQPRFLYTHTGPSHAPFSGQCQPEEQIALFETRLSEANLEMRKDISDIISNDPNAIIVVAGDHGPYLTKNCYFLNNVYASEEINRLDLQSRFGAFLSIKMPDNHQIPRKNIRVLQDVFPEILDYLTESNEFSEMKVKPITVQDVTSSVHVDNGIIKGGLNDGEPLYLSN